MKKLIISVFLLLIIGCEQKPIVGDWYIHEGTGEKIKILFIGKGTSAYNYSKNCVMEMWKNVPEDKIARASYFIYYSEYDSAKECIVWNANTNPFYPKYVVCAEEDFVDYKLIEQKK